MKSTIANLICAQMRVATPNCGMWLQGVVTLHAQGGERQIR